MKTVTLSSPSITTRPPLWFGNVLRVLLASISWALLLVMVLLTALAIGWILLGVVLLGAGPSADADIPPLLVAGGTWVLSFPDQALFLARDIVWGPSDVWDYQKFPARAVNNAPPVFHFQQSLQPELFQTMTIEYKQAGQVQQANFEDLLKSTQTTSLIVIKDDAIRYEGYFNGYNRDSIVTSFSMAKSVTSALIGIAIDKGRIGGVDDPIIAYLPELRGKGLDAVTIRHLPLMASGIRYVSDDEISGPSALSPFSDDGLSYSYPNLRSRALSMPPDGKGPGAEFNYNNYNPTLLGISLERATHMSLAQYLQEKIWAPLGMEYPATWSLDSEASGFEATLCCLNGRAIDFAKFGRLFLHNGNWNGQQIISEQWVKESTSPYPTNPNDAIDWRANTWFSDWRAPTESGIGYYKYQWWGVVLSILCSITRAQSVQARQGCFVPGGCSYPHCSHPAN